MGQVRMFHYSCDKWDVKPEFESLVSHYGCEDSTADEYYASMAKETAQAQGWHVNGTRAICSACWSDGLRFKHLKGE